MTTQPSQMTNIVIPSQNTTMTITSNTMTQPQNTSTVLNIFNLTSQPMGTMTGATAGESGSQSNTISNINTGRGHFSHFGTIRANP